MTSCSRRWAPVRDHRNGVRNRSEALSAFNRNTCPPSSESATWPAQPFLPSRPGEFHPEPLTGRVEDWRAGLGRSLYSLFLALSFASVTLSRPCHVSSPRHVERSVRISRTALSCLLHLKGYGTYRAGATFGISQRTL